MLDLVVGVVHRDDQSSKQSPFLHCASSYHSKNTKFICEHQKQSSQNISNRRKQEPNKSSDPITQYILSRCLLNCLLLYSKLFCLFFLLVFFHKRFMYTSQSIHITNVLEAMYMYILQCVTFKSILLLKSIAATIFVIQNG